MFFVIGVTVTDVFSMTISCTLWFCPKFNSFSSLFSGSNGVKKFRPCNLCLVVHVSVARPDARGYGFSIPTYSIACFAIEWATFLESLGGEGFEILQ